MHRRPDSLRPRRCAGTPFTVAASLALTVGLLGSATAAHAAEVPQASPTPAASATAQHPALKATAVGELVLNPGEKPNVDTEVKWTITITNTGDIPLDDVAPALSDHRLDLQPGQTSELTTSSTLDQNDLANGHTAVDLPISGTTPDGARIEAPLTGHLTLPTPQSAPTTAGQGALTATTVGELVLNPGEEPNVGTEVKWTITVTNTGDVPLDDVAYVLIGYHLDLQPGQTSELTTSSTLDHNDLANGHTAVDIPVSGTTPDGARIEAPLTGRLTLPTPQSAPTTPASVPTTPATTSATPIPAPAVPVPMHTPGTPAVVLPAASGTTS